MPQVQGDVLTGDDDANTIRGTGGKDVISARDGDDDVTARDSGDAISGGDGADTLLEGDGDGLVVADRGDALLDGGDGIDTVILAPGTTPYTFSTANMRGVEAIQDAPGTDTTIVFDARILASANDDSFLFALGDGIDEVRIENATGTRVTVQDGDVVSNGEVVLRFEGVENLVLSGGDGESSSVVTQSLSPGQASATTVHSVSGDDGSTTTTVTSVTNGTAGVTADNPAASEESPTAVAGPGSPAASIADALFGGTASSTDLGALAQQLFDLLEVHAEAADFLRAETASSADTGSVEDPFDLLLDNAAAGSDADLLGAG